MSHRIARSLSASTPMISAIYRMGAASLSICRSFSAQCSTLGVEVGKGRATPPAVRSIGGPAKPPPVLYSKNRCAH